MTVETRRRHTREFVETMLGPAIYIVYLVLAYAASSVACMLGEGTTPTLPDAATTARNALLVLTVAALGATALVALLAARRLAASKGHARNNRAENDQDLFMALLTLALALLSALAILWTGIATLPVPACA